MRRLLGSNKDTSGLVEKYVGSAYDAIFAIYENLSTLLGAGDKAVEAQNWANMDEDVLVPEGDQVDDYSALHHARKAAVSALGAANSASAAAVSEANASASETNASASSSAAALSETNAATSESNAAASEAMSQKWASELEDVEVVPGYFSSYHWAQKAADSAAQASQFDPSSYLPKDGSQAMTGPLSLPTDPTSALHAATKQYADLKLAQTGGTLTGDVTISKAAPTLKLIDGADEARFILSGGIGYLQGANGKFYISDMFGQDLVELKARFDGLYRSVLHTGTQKEYASRAALAAANVSPSVQFVRVAGYATEGDGGEALYKRVAVAPAHPGGVQSADGAWWELVSSRAGLDPRQLGAKGDGVTDDATALANWIGADALTKTLILPQGTYLTSAGLVGTDGPVKIVGGGWQRLSPFNPPSLNGSILKASSTAVTNLLTLQSTDPSQQDVTDINGLKIEDLVLWHRGSGAALRIDNVFKQFISNVQIICDDEGARGIELANQAFFATIYKCVVSEFTDIGILIDGTGTQHFIRECHVAATNETAKAAVEIRRRDFLVDGGQYNVNRSDNTGIGILCYNYETGATQQGGRIRNILSEADIGVVIDGDVKPFGSIIIETPHFNLNQVSKGVVFKNAIRCVLDRPSVRNISSGGILCEWDAQSQDCGLVCDIEAAQAPIIVHPSATRAWKHVTGYITRAERDAITTDPNLITTCEWVEGIGPCVHNGTAWDVFRVSIADDTAASFTPPTANGTVEILTHADADYYWLGGHQQGTTRTYAAGADFENWASDGMLTGTTGTDGKLTVRMNSADGKLYVENRVGNTQTIWVRFKRSVL